MAWRWFIAILLLAFTSATDVSLSNGRSHWPSYRILPSNVIRSFSKPTTRWTWLRGERGKRVYIPNPQLQIYGDELGDRTGPSGIWTAPSVTQEFVTAKKLPLARAAASREVDQASLGIMTQRFTLLTSVRQAYYDLLATEARVQALQRLVWMSDQSVNTSKKLLAAKQVSQLDLAQLELDYERYRAENEAARRELPGAFRRLAATVGATDLPMGPIAGSINDPLPDYDFENARAYVLGVSPELQSARLGIERAKLLLARSQAEACPNVTLGANYVRQGQNRSSDWGVSMTLPVPVWNRNQGNIQAAQAQLGDAIQEVARIETDLIDRVAVAFRDFESARYKSERYWQSIVPRAREIALLSEKAFQSGQLEYLKMLEAQRSVEQAALEYIKVRGEAWKAAATISGLALEEQWPPAPNAAQP